MELREYIDVLYNRKWIIVSTVVIVLAVTLVFTFLAAPVYQSSVEILTEPNTASESVTGTILTSFLYNPDRFMQNQAKIIKTGPLAEAVKRQLDYKYDLLAREDDKDAYIPESVPTASELKGMVTVQPGQKNSIFSIVVTGGNASLTRDVAQAYANEYMENRKLAAIQQVSEARKEVWNRLTEVEEELNKAASEIKGYKPGEVPTELAAAADRASALYTTLYEKYITLRIAESLQQRGLEIIEPAGRGGKIGATPMRNGILALFVGLMLGVGLAFLADYMDDTLHTREDFERYYDTTVVGEIPFIPGEELPEHHIIYFEKPRHPAVEGYRTLRTNLQFLNLDGGRSAILLTSALPGEGKSTIMVNLGAALSEMGKKVLLVEADLRKPVLTRFFDVTPHSGISGVLTGTSPLEDAIYKTRFDNLDILPAGVKPPNPGELVASDEMRHILKKVRDSYDYVLVDAPPALAASDAVALAPMVDGVLMVGRYEMANRESAHRSVEMLRKVEANILGLVINNIEVGKRYSYYHYFYYDATPKRRRSDGGSSKKVPRRGKPRRTPPGQD